MEVGLFDHIGRANTHLAKLFDDRISFYSAADKMGFYCMQARLPGFAKPGSSDIHIHLDPLRFSHTEPRIHIPR